MKDLSVSSGKELVKRLEKHLGYRKLRQRGSHVRLKSGKSKITVSLHKELDKGTKQAIIIRLPNN